MRRRSKSYKRHIVVLVKFPVDSLALAVLIFYPGGMVRLSNLGMDDCVDQTRTGELLPIPVLTGTKTYVN